MITKHKAVDITSLLFVVMIFVLIYNIISKFEILDFAYLLFVIGCFIRYIYIKTH